ncbi:MAG: SH3 domain-containing protein [Bacillota bacterium]
MYLKHWYLRAGFLVAFFLGAAFFGVCRAEAAAVAVTGDIVNLRSGPGTGYSKVGEVSRGTQLAVVGQSGGWYRVQLQTGTLAWIAGWLVKPVAVSSGSGTSRAGSLSAAVAVTGDIVNLRSGPGTGYRKVGEVSRGTQLAVVGQSGGWYRVQLQTGTLAWIAGWLVKPVAVSSGSGTSRAGSLSAAVAVTGDIVNLRSGPGTGYRKVGEVSRGTQLAVVGQSGGWYKVRLASGALAWIAGWLVKPVAVSPGSEASRAGSLPSTQTTECWVTVTGDYANLYSGPGTNYAKVGEASPGTQLAVIEQSGDWYKVRLQTGSEMWINRSSTRPVSGAVSQVPVSRTRDEDGLIGFDAKESGPVTEIGFTFVRPVDAQVSLSAVPPRLVVEIAGLPSGELGKGWDFDSGIVSRVYAEWVREEPPVARVVLDLKTSGAVSYQTLSSPDKRVLKLRLAAGPLYAVSGRVIVLDPGHGGSDPGALGPSGLQEKDFNLDVALLTAEELRGRGAQVFLTREADQYVDLYARTAKANSLGAAVFVSIHGNAAESPRLASLKAGTSTYWYAPADDPVLGFQREKRELLARCLQKSLVDKLGRKDLGLFTANFVVLRTATMPAALVEVAFVSNPEEEGLMRADWFRQAAARALVEGLEDYFQQAG